MKVTRTIVIEYDNETQINQAKKVLDEFEFSAKGLVYIKENYNAPFVGAYIRQMVKKK